MTSKARREVKNPDPLAGLEAWLPAGAAEAIRQVVATHEARIKALEDRDQG